MNIKLMNIWFLNDPVSHRDWKGWLMQILYIRGNDKTVNTSLSKTAQTLNINYYNYTPHTHTHSPGLSSGVAGELSTPGLD